MSIFDMIFPKRIRLAKLSDVQEGERVGVVVRPASNITTISRSRGPSPMAVADFKRVCDQTGLSRELRVEGETCVERAVRATQYEGAFQVGDLVTRDGSDVHRVTEADDGYGCITVVCIKEPLGFLRDDGTREEPWCKVGDVESNLSGRYVYASAAVENEVDEI